MRRTIHLRIVRFVFTAIAILSVAQAWADATVYVRLSGFSPSSVSIDVGDTVYWVQADNNGPYCVQSTKGLWTPWYLWDLDDWFSYTFNEAGDYEYFDAFSYNTGVIHVGTSVPNLPPEVTIVSPTEGQVVTEPASFTFAATVTDPDNGVMQVEFYVGGDLVGTVYSAPFSAQVNNLAAGDYTLTLLAYDNAWATTMKYVNISVRPGNPTDITLNPPSLAAGQFQVAASGLTVGKQAVLQAATSLGASANWVSLQTNDIVETTLSFSQPVLPGAHFFRVVQLPSP